MSDYPLSPHLGEVRQVRVPSDIYLTGPLSKCAYLDLDDTLYPEPLMWRAACAPLPTSDRKLGLEEPSEFPLMLETLDTPRPGAIFNEWLASYAAIRRA